MRASAGGHAAGEVAVRPFAGAGAGVWVPARWGTPQRCGCAQALVQQQEVEWSFFMGVAVWLGRVVCIRMLNLERAASRSLHGEAVDAV